MSNIPDLVPADTTVDNALWLQAAAQSVRSYCGWHIAPSITQTILCDGTGTQTLFLPSRHVSNIRSVMVSDEEMVGDMDWSVDGMIRLRSNYFPDQFGSVKVSLDHGYDYEEVADVTAIVLKLAQRASTGPGIIASQQVNGSSVSYFAAGGAPLSTPLLQIEKDALEPYRLKKGVI